MESISSLRRPVLGSSDVRKEKSNEKSRQKESSGSDSEEALKDREEEATAS